MQWRITGRFKDDRITCGQRRSHFVAHKTEWEIEGSDGSHHSARNAQGEPQFILDTLPTIQRQDFPTKTLRLFTTKLDCLRGSLDFGSCLLNRLALFTAQHTANLSRRSINRSAVFLRI